MSSLEFGIIGAAPVNPVFMKQIEREIPIKKILCQAYGQTENTGAMTLGIYAGENKESRYTSVGKATPQIEIKIAGANGRVLPVGEEGEICARGFNIMKGLLYLSKKILFIYLYL
jgi:fatty-acyl-CoA synthase